MKYSCKIKQKNISLIINIILHILLLLVIISTFYFLYVSNIAEASFKNEIKHAINDNLLPPIINADKNGEFKQTLKDIDLQNMRKHFETANDITKLQNEWLVKVNYGVVIGLLILLIVAVFILYFSCGKVPYISTLRENIILFSLVATVEVLFFLFIGRKFIPTKPSLIMKTLVNSINNNLQ